MQIKWLEITVETEGSVLHIYGNVLLLQSLWTNVFFFLFVYVCLKVSVLCDNAGLFCICAASADLLHCRC